MVTTIAKEFGVRVIGQYDDAGRRKMLTAHLEGDVLRLRDLGKSQEEIGRAVGCSQAVVSRILIQNGRRTREPQPKGEAAVAWKGGRTVTGSGYIQVGMSEDHPFAAEMRSRMGYVLEHRLVMAEYFGRPLRHYETVHHINGDRTDNRLENLQVRFGNHGKGIKLKCACCGSSNLVEDGLD
jgi:hypothetical protein